MRTTSTGVLPKADAGLTLTAAADGVGLPESFDQAVSGGIGMNLVRMMVDQIDGTFTMARGPGARFSIRLKP